MFQTQTTEYTMLKCGTSHIQYAGRTNFLSAISSS